MKGNVLILGKDGQLGRAIANVLKERAIALSRKDVNLLDRDFLLALENEAKKQPIVAVINAAAYTQVDNAEKDKETAFRVNGEAVRELASWCKAKNLPLIHFSTDYVFDGSGNMPRHEDERPQPVNAYGQSKLLGENALAEVDGKYLLFRTSWVYDAHGKNFFNTILRLIKEKEQLNVVSDQVGAPSYAPHLAEAVVHILERALEVKKFPKGLYHLCHSGEASWFEFAQAIFALARSHDSGIRCEQINPIPTAEYPLPAKRPLNSRLDCSKAYAVFGVTMPHWKEGLKDCIDETYGHQELQHSGT